MKNNKIIFGIALLIFGLVLTFLTKYIAEKIAIFSGGDWYIYIIAFGPLIYGFALVFGSIEDHFKKRRKTEKPLSVVENKPVTNIIKIPYNSELENRRRMIYIKLCFYLILIVLLISLVTQKLEVLYGVIVPLIYGFFKYLSYRDEKKSDEKLEKYRKDMDRLKPDID
ncbi:MAG: hypothetical protein ABIJ97_16455 [Bacteroidota bacterium]